MAVRTITIDIDAYNLLSRHKGIGQSFSQVIKAHFGQQFTAATFRALVRGIRVSDDTLDAMDAQVRARSKDPARAVTQ